MTTSRHSNEHPRERDRLVNRYEGWQKIRDAAVKNSKGSAPPIVFDQSYPPMPQPIDDADIADLSLELNNVQLDENLHGVDDMVPEADPEVDVSPSCSMHDMFTHTTYYLYSSNIASPILLLERVR